MAQWDIRVLHQPPIRVEVERDRNLIEEFEQVLAVRRTFTQWLRRMPVYWQITETVCLDRDSVLGIASVPAMKRRKKAPIGFQVGESS